MNLHHILKNSEMLITRNSPAILTAIGIAGTVGTAYLTGKASIKAYSIIEKNIHEHNERYTYGYKQGSEDGYRADPFLLSDKFKMVWKLYIPPAVACTATVASIFFANRIGTRRAAAIAAAYTLSDKAFQEYKEKVREHISKPKEQKIRDDIAQKNADENPPTSSNTVVVDKEGTQLFREVMSGRYFQSTVEDVRSSVNLLNQDINNHGYASLNDFYSLLGLEANDMGNQLGWSQRLMEVDLSSAGILEGRPFIQLGYYNNPQPDYDRFH